MEQRFIVAIGMSAGGLNPLTQMLDAVPHDQATYIILRHIPVEHQSILHSILQRHSKLTIVEAQNGMRIEKDYIYIPPAASHMTILNNELYLHEREPGQTPNWGINIFLESLAHWKASNSIAVLLSGSGSDGSKGMMAIKEAGGMTVVQDPLTCEHPGMVMNAIRSNSVDVIALPAEIPAIVLRHVSEVLKGENLVKNMNKIGGTAEH